MGARIVEIGPTRWTVWVNTMEVRPSYDNESEAMERAEREARRYRIVTVSKASGNRRPRTVATWTDGKRDRK